MIEIKGDHGSALVFTDDLENTARGLLQAYCDQPHSAENKIRIMPDVHAGAGCTIGTTMTISDKVVPNIVGVDIGCGMNIVKLKDKRIDLPKLDSFIRKNIPYGFDVRTRPHRGHGRIDLNELRCAGKIDLRKAKESLGTLGGGNHFIEIDREGEDLYLIIHTGSRNPGLKVAQYYQQVAYDSLGEKNRTEIPYEMAYLTGQDMEDYLHDMEIMQRFAEINRQIIREEILDGMKLKEDGGFETIHNYIDMDSMILRKGAVSAKMGEKLLIPMNMRDGCLVCTGLGNEDWNHSAPHGAGRVMSRKEAKDSITLSSVKEEMKGIFTTSLDKDTLDEAPGVYKPMDEIISHIADTVTVDKVIKPIYNFKAGENVRRKK